MTLVANKTGKLNIAVTRVSLGEALKASTDIPKVDNPELERSILRMFSNKVWEDARIHALRERSIDPLGGECFALYAYGKGRWDDVLVVPLGSVSLALFGDKDAPMTKTIVRNVVMGIFNVACEKEQPEAKIITGGSLDTHVFRCCFAMMSTALNLNAEVEQVIRTLTASGVRGWLVLDSTENLEVAS